MRLYLSSFRLGDHTQALTELAPPPGPAVVIANAIDAAPSEDRAKRVAEELDRVAGLGYEVSELDLRDHLSDRAGLADRLAAAELVWVRGGNVFVLRHLLAVTGADAMIVEHLARDTFCYGGYSAGPCVLGPHLRGLEICDPVAELTEAYGAQARFDGLGVLDRVVVPHLDSPDHFETAVLARVAEIHEAAGEPYLGLRDGEVWLAAGDPAEGRLLPRRQ
ncbi:Type 1 glutamine amidotransferase-like domain-containing protein [Parenemella sanctibonifatiensis]|uniref:Peptidase n=1 Tax=Parenemella sanctibonifatiensis TaxID=2016505 RepID=A0A255ELG2_9ACTN|nr:Type 1 glutamine amidotransferase-like domain-containing protein [Parenemella sanctibonifatiensis]OYN92369.1 peptidase [Parenemella sanctibonifatiensis]